MGSLKLFVKAVRKAKTIADERTVVRKESAALRTSFRDPNLDQNTRRVNISKLLYLYIIGEKTHFGQVECIKLLASPRFADKRLGYLASMLLLDENQEVLTLLTNSLDNDMQHPNPFIVGLALTCLGNIASPELARDLYANVNRILDTNNSVYLKKKAVLVSAKLVERDPDLSEVFTPKLSNLINDKTPLILMATCHLTQSIYTHSPEYRTALAKMMPRFIAHLKRVISAGYLPEYDVSGVTDPFLQVSLISTLRTLGTDENCTPKNLEDFNDILTQVALNLDTGKNAAHAILYECVKTIFAIESDQSLRVLGVNLLGKFLQIKDNNTRYVALEMLLTVVEYEPLAVQRHRSTIVSCLADGDISIRRRALELTFAIINEQNIRVLMREILSFLEACPDSDLKVYVSSQLAIAAGKYSPNEKWHFDTLVRMLKLAGNFVTPDMISNTLSLVMRCSDNDLKRHVVSKLIQSSMEDHTQYGLALVTVWCSGEYADLVLNTGAQVNGKSDTIKEATLLDLIDAFINNTTFSDSETVHLVTYILTALIKLSVKLSDSKCIERLRLIINSKTYDTNLEIQTRAIEYQQILGQDIKLRQGLLSRMPAPPVKEMEGVSLQGKPKPKIAAQSGSSQVINGPDDLLDLLEELPGSINTPHQKTNNDLLADLFEGASRSKPLPGAGVQNQGLLSDLFQGSSDSALKAESTNFNSIEVFSNGHLKISFTPLTFGAGRASVEVNITSSSPSEQIENVQLLIAVPKTQKLTIVTTSGTDLLVGKDVIKQLLKVEGKEGLKVKLRVKVKYSVNMTPCEDQFDYAGFSKTL